MREWKSRSVWLACVVAALGLVACSDGESGGTDGGPSRDAGVSPCQGDDPDPTCEQSCSGPDDCPSGFHCAEDGTCNAQCGSEGGCPFTHSCDEDTGTCIAESGPCASSNPPEGCGDDCGHDGDCPFEPQPMWCIGAICTAECDPETHEGCAPDQRCGYEGFCEEGSRDAGQTMEEVCNGEDDDGNGIIDDVDVDGDGICDCLRIATLGIPGQHSDGTEVFGEWLEERSDFGAVRLTPGDPDEQTATDQTITPELIEDFEVIVVENASILDEFTQAEIDAIEQWVRDGGGLMTLIGYAGPSERANVNSILAPLGVQYGEEQILASPDTVPITNWETHPTTENISQVGVDNGYPVVPLEGEDAVGSPMVVASEDGHDVAVVNEVGDGRVFVWGDEWITYDSEWDKPGYQVERFWLNVIKWLTPANICQVDLPPFG
ncbi:MAG: hypothetical protein ACODAU_07205 [Myxococcota bacterium]